MLNVSPTYVRHYVLCNAQNTAYKFNGKWNFAQAGNSGKVSTEHSHNHY